MTELSNPFSTGSGGATFEGRVQSSFFVTMLCNGFVPGVPDGDITKIKLQGRIEGYETDDCVLYIQSGNDFERKFLCQIKHSLSFTKSDETLKEVLSSAWSDFTNASVFDPSKDILSLITGPLSKIDTEHVRPILSWARYVETAQDFINRVGSSNFSHRKKAEKLDVIKYHLEAAKGTSLTDDELWSFCKSWTLLGYDLSNDTSSQRALLLNLINVSKTDSSRSAESIWTEILEYISNINSGAGVISLKDIDQKFKGYFSKQILSHDSIQRLKDHGSVIKKRIKEGIDGFHFERVHLQTEILEKYFDNQVTIVSGPAGVGKSAIVKNLFKSQDEKLLFYLRAEDLNFSHIDKFINSIGIKDRLSQLSNQLILLPEKVLVIESMEKLLELENTEAVKDLFMFIKKDSSWKIIATCRDYSLNQIMTYFLATEGFNASIVKVTKFDEDEITVVKNKFPQLKPYLEDSQLKSLLKNPFYLNFAYQLSATDNDCMTLDKFREGVWNGIIAKEVEAKDGMPRRRKDTFITVCVRRAKEMSLAVLTKDLDLGALEKLKKDDLICEFDEGHAPSHDLLEDWAIEKYIEGNYTVNASDPIAFFTAIGSELAIKRTFRYWLQNKIKETSNTLERKSFILKSLREKDLPSHWKDELITSILLAGNAYEFLEQLGNDIFENNNNLLIRFCFMLQIACKDPNYCLLKELGYSNSEAYFYGSSFLEPIGQGWPDLIRFLYQNKEKLDSSFIPYVKPVLTDWTSKVAVGKQAPECTREAGLLGIHFLDFLKGAYNEDEVIELVKVVIRAYGEIKEEVNKKLENQLFGAERKNYGRHYQYIETFCELVLSSLDCSHISYIDPELVVRISWQWWKIEDEDKENDPYGHRREVTEDFGFKNNYSRRSYSPECAIKGPFFSLLKADSKVALNYIINLCNYAAEKYVSSKRFDNEIYLTEIQLPASDKIELINSDRLWMGYRSNSVVPSFLRCSLMALEKWLVEVESKRESFSSTLTYIIEHSNSVLPISLIVGLAPEFWPKMGDVIYSILKVRDFYSIDHQRMLTEYAEGVLDFLNWDTSPEATIYNKERKDSNSYKWRSKHLEDVVRNMIITEGYNVKVSEIIDEFKKSLPVLEQQTHEDKTWRIALLRMDMRKFKPEVDKKNDQIIFHPPEPEEDIKKIQKCVKTDHNLMNRHLMLKTWGMQKFQGEKVSSDYPDWMTAFEEVKWFFKESFSDDKNRLASMFMGGAIFALSYCLKEHSDEMTQDDLDWGTHLICEIIDSTANNFSDRYGDSHLDGKYSASYALLVLYKQKKLSVETLERVKNAIACAVTHPDHNIQEGVGLGIREYLWSYDSEFAKNCFEGSIEHSKTHLEAIYKHRYVGSNDREKENEEVLKTVAIVRGKILHGNIKSNIENIEFKTHSSWDLRCALSMIPNSNICSECELLLKKILTIFINYETGDKSEKHNRIGHKFQIIFEKRIATIFLSEDYEKVMSSYSAELIALKKAPDLFEGIVKDLYSDIRPFEQGYGWKVWERLINNVGEEILEESKQSFRRINYSDYSKLLRAFFVYHIEWERENQIQKDFLKHGIGSMAVAFNKFGEHPIVYESFLKLCFYHYSRFMPDAIIGLSKNCNNDNREKIFSTINAQFYLQRILQSYVLRNFRLLKENPSLRSSVVCLLDHLVESGSSSGYFLRDRVVTMM